MVLALNALVYFFKDVCGRKEVDLGVRLRKGVAMMPTVLGTDEVKGLIERIDGRYRMATRLQYGTGLRLSELVRLRIKDIDLGRGTVTVRSGKGNKDYPLLRRRSAVSRNAPPHSWKGRRYRAMAVNDDAAEKPARGGGGAD